MNSINNQICDFLTARGVSSASELAKALGISQPTISRALISLGSQRILRIGRARSARYALRDQNRANESSVYLIDASGNTLLLGVLYALADGAYVFSQEKSWKSLRGDDFKEGLYPGLPWFLRDMRPRGFLGRSFARSHARALNAQLDPSEWSDAQVLDALCRYGEDMPGAFVLGQEMLTRVQDLSEQTRDWIQEKERARDYPQFAERSLCGEWPGSSAAGEQPKFLATVCDTSDRVRHVLVKFSGNTDQPEARRWSDLLHAEYHANKILSEAGESCALSRIVQAAGRTFLESERFDRCGSSGRRAVVSLEALDAAYLGLNGMPWNRAAGKLRDAGWISHHDAERLSLYWWFGVLIGNSDMHYGNISLFLDPEPPLTLSPLYDMLPMSYRPGVDGTLPFHVIKLMPSPPEERKTWVKAAGLARIFWARVASDDTISIGFRDIATANHATLSVMTEA